MIIIKDGNRTRPVQLHFRLSEEENQLLQQEIAKSGLKRNEFFIRLLINRIGLSAVNCKRKISRNDMELQFTLGNKTVGYASCFHNESENLVQICSLYVIPAFRGYGIEDQLLDEVELYAKAKGASSLVGYCGPEPYCPGEWLTEDKAIALYQAHGYQETGRVCHVVPKMEKMLI